MINKKSISLIIPAYNEEPRLEKVVENYYLYLKSNFSEFELIIVCNNCSDKTPEIAKRLSEKHESITCLNFPFYTGKGGAVVRGFQVAKNDLIGFVDADESTVSNEFHKLVKEIDYFDCVIASRKVNEARLVLKQPFTRRFLGSFYRKIVNLLFGLNLQDTQCGAKLFRKKAIKKVLPLLKSNGWAFDVEILWRLKIKGYSIKEQGIYWKNSADSKVKPWHVPGIFLELIKIRFLY